MSSEYAYATYYSYSGGTNVSEMTECAFGGTNKPKTPFCRGSGQGGGVGGIYGINCAEYSDGANMNYKFYNLCVGVIMMLDNANNEKSAGAYTASDLWNMRCSRRQTHWIRLRPASLRQLQPKPLGRMGPLGAGGTRVTFNGY